MNIFVEIGLIIFAVFLGWFLHILYQNWRDRRQKREDKEQKEKEKDEILFDNVLKEISELVQYRETGTTHQSVTKWTSKIYQLSLNFKTGKFDDVLPAIKRFGEKYKDSIPPSGARTEVMAKYKKFWQEAKELKLMIEERIK